MKRQGKRSGGVRAGLLGLGLLAGGACGGCWLIDNCSSIPPGALPAPNGSYVHKFQDVQAAKAEASDFVVFLDEWYMGGTKLGPHGLYHLTQMVHRLPTVPFPVVIQPCGDPALNEIRRQVVIDGLLSQGIADAPQRVIIAYPQAEGLRGVEAEVVYYNMIASFAVRGSVYNQLLTPYGFGGYGAGFYTNGRFVGGYGVAGY